MITRSLRLFPWFLLILILLLVGGCGGGGSGGGTGGATGGGNVAPTLSPIGNKVVAPDNNLSFTVTASAASPQDTVQLFAEGLPPGATFSPATGIFSWTPTSLQLGEYSVTFIASNGVNEATETIAISVRNALVLTLSTQAATVTENELLEVTVLASDTDGNPTSLSVSGLPPGASFNQGNGIFRWTPQLVTPGQFPVVVTATNGNTSTSKILTITYTRTNPLLATDITDPVLRGSTIFPQTTPALDGVPELFPGQANFWDLDPDIAQFDGFWNQFLGNMVLAVEADIFPEDQTYDQLTFMTPLLSVQDGLQVAAVADHAGYTGPDPDNAIPSNLDEGSASAWLNATADSRLQQAIDLSLASAPLTLTWMDEFLAQSLAFTFFDDISDTGHYYRVVATDQASGIRTVLFDGPVSTRSVVETTPSRQRVVRTADLRAFAGKQLVLSFELRGAHQLLFDALGNFEFLGSYARIDNVSLRDASNSEHVVNGEFENGMTGWAANAGGQSQNLRSAPRSLGDLIVTRHFYAVPNQLWARWTDVFENPTDAPISRRVFLRTFLGSAGKGIIYLNDGVNPRALTSWDGTNPNRLPLPDGTIVLPDRDIGLVFGNPTSIFGNSLPDIVATNAGINANISATALDTADGSDTIEIVHNVTVPPLGQVTLVHFALMSGENTGATAIDTNARATTIDSEITKILANFHTDPRYRDGMTQAQLDSLQNF